MTTNVFLDDIVASAFEAIDEVFAEDITITPQKSGEFTAAGPDATNPPYVLTGVFELSTVIDEGAGEKSGSRTELVTTAPTAEFPYASFGVGAPFPLVGWHVSVQATPLRPPPLNFTIVSRLPDGDDGRVRFQLRPLP